MPFGSIANQGLPIDATCGFSGSAAANTPEGKQNIEKNNFCAVGNPVTVTPTTLLQLQQTAQVKGIPFGSAEKLPPDRSVLQNLSAAGAKFSEGMLVRMAAFIVETHFADLSSGESVNCDVKEDSASNDIHMALGTAYGADECTSVTAEITPHFRPKAWNAIAGIEAKGKTNKPAAITRYPIRVTGQLFFDASHKPCLNGKPENGSPARQSDWEIHPVYGIDVCKNETLAACSVGDETVWTPFEKWSGK